MPSAHFHCLASRAGLGTISHSSDTIASLWGGAAKTFCWAKIEPMSKSAFDVLTSSRVWESTPHDYSSMRYLQFQSDGNGLAMYGYGQTIYAEIAFRFSIADDTLNLIYLNSEPYQHFLGFTPTDQTRCKTLLFKLTEGDYTFKMTVVRLKYRFSTKLSLSASPYPDGIDFPYSVPTDFFGFREEVRKPWWKFW